MDPESLWEPPKVPPDSVAFTLAVAADIDRRDSEGHPLGVVACCVLLALAEQIDNLSGWLARRPDAKPADRVALARLFAQFEGTYERAIGPVVVESHDGLGAILAAFGAAEAGNAA